MFIIMGNVDADDDSKVCIFDIVPGKYAEPAYNFRNMSELYKAVAPPWSHTRVSMSEYLKTHPYPICLKNKLWT